MDRMIIYTDGACSGNPGVGGWGAVLIDNNGTRQEIFGGERYTTNNKMELMAAIMALKSLKKKCDVTIYTDSQYVRLGITEWIKKWKNNGWKNSQKQDVKNRELWEDLLSLCEFHNVEWHWVKGHDNNELNERADFLARSGCVRALCEE